jgi:hypothetical protein
MPRLNSRIFVLVAAMFAVSIAGHTPEGVRAQRARATDNYVLDNPLGEIALYPGFGYRSYIEPKYMISSLEELERRVGQLPAGTKLHWGPYKRDSSGKPILFSDGQYEHFAKFCRDHKIQLLISPSHPSNGKAD